MKGQNIVIGLSVLIVVGLILYMYSNKKEKYENIFFNKDLNSDMYQRPTFSSNLDPTNLNLRYDPYVYGGYIKGNSPQDSGVLASTNQPSYPQRSKEGFDYLSNVTHESGSGVQTGNSSSDYDIDVYKTSSNPMSLSARNVQNNDTDYENYADMVEIPKRSKDAYMNSIEKRDTLKYTLPKDLLPVPDMRSSMTRDPSDPSNFMYDRTLTAPLKKRNRNESDRIRGDLDIAPIKTGWFDVATVPSVDIIKGYFGVYNDIQETQELQDIIYDRSGDQKLQTADGHSDTVFNAKMSILEKEFAKPKLAYATPPNLSFGPLNKQYKENNPWYSTVNHVGKNQFVL